MNIKIKFITKNKLLFFYLSLCSFSYNIVLFFCNLRLSMINLCLHFFLFFSHTNNATKNIIFFVFTAALCVIFRGQSKIVFLIYCVNFQLLFYIFLYYYCNCIVYISYFNWIIILLLFFGLYSIAKLFCNILLWGTIEINLWRNNYVVFFLN